MKLLSDLADTPADKRSARFRTVAVVCWPDGQELIAEGSVEGFITTEPRGAHGFGYDAVFVPAESAEGFAAESVAGSDDAVSGGDASAGGGADVLKMRRTFAEMSATEKNLISHRGRAFRTLARLLNDFHVGSS